jgi:NAD(P)-dependent dehydrogenase (short-subunit alcohol dehydrogenase family)
MGRVAVITGASRGMGAATARWTASYLLRLSADESCCAEDNFPE